MGKVSNGFTLLELVIVIALIAITATLAVPGLRSFMTLGRRATEINRLRRDLNYARSEAVARGLTVSLCTSTDGNTCTGKAGISWDDGWIVFVDNDADLNRDPKEALLRVEPAFTGNDELSGNRLLAHHIGYQREGFLQGVHNGTITFTSASGRVALRRCLIISRTGRIRTVDSSDSLCDGENGD